MSPSSRRPRVAVVTHGYYPRIGGSERYHRITAKALSASAEVEVFTARPGRHEPLPAVPRTVTLDGVTVHYLPWVPLGGERFLLPWSLSAALRRFDPDLVWGNFPSASADLGAIFALRRHRPWAASYHADLSEARLRNRLFNRWEIRLLRRASAVLVQTDRYAHILRDRGIATGRLSVSPPGPLLGNGTPPGPLGTSVGSGSLPGTDHPFLFVGVLDTHHTYKGLDRLIRAVAALSASGTPVNLEVVGEGPLRPTYEHLARDLGVAQCIRFLGRLDDNGVAGRFRSAWALTVPSPSELEGFGAVAVEAAWYECPSVISSAVASAGFWRDRGTALPYDPSTSDGLETALRAIWVDPELRARLAAATRSVRAELSWDRLSPSILAPLLALLPEGAPRSR